MKKKFKILLVLSLFSLSAFSVQAQKSTSVSASWVSEKGYWVLHSDLHSPLNHIIRFYNNENELVHTETLVGVKLDINKRKVKMKLKKALEETFLLYSQHKKPDAISDYIAGILK